MVTVFICLKYSIAFVCYHHKYIQSPWCGGPGSTTSPSRRWTDWTFSPSRSTGVYYGVMKEGGREGGVWSHYNVLWRQDRTGLGLSLLCLPLWSVLRSVCPPASHPVDSQTLTETQTVSHCHKASLNESLILCHLTYGPKWCSCRL